MEGKKTTNTVAFLKITLSLNQQNMVYLKFSLSVFDSRKICKQLIHPALLELVRRVI